MQSITFQENSFCIFTGDYLQIWPLCRINELLQRRYVVSCVYVTDTRKPVACHGDVVVYALCDVCMCGALIQRNDEPHVSVLVR